MVASSYLCPAPGKSNNHGCYHLKIVKAHWIIPLALPDDSAELYIHKTMLTVAHFALFKKKMPKGRIKLTYLSDKQPLPYFDGLLKLLILPN